MTDNFLTVEPYEVQHGDILAGVPGANGHPVDQILQDGNDGWWIYASGGTILARRAPWSRVQVVRDSPAGGSAGDSGRVELSSGDSPTATSDDWCNPAGITRVRGFYVVTP